MSNHDSKHSKIAVFISSALLCVTAHAKVHVEMNPSATLSSATNDSLQTQPNLTDTSSTPLQAIPLPSKVLRIVGTSDSSILFEKKKYKHGLGYSLSNDLAFALKLQPKFKRVTSNKLALKAVKDGTADIAITTADDKSVDAQSLSKINVGCDAPKNLAAHGLNANLGFVVPKQASTLGTFTTNFVCGGEQKNRTQGLFGLYDRNFSGRSGYKKALNARLPMMKSTFQLYAKRYKMDWKFLVALSFQESYLMADSVSPTGVTGVMMLTRPTASQMGVIDRNDPVESIQGGSRYIALMLSSYANIANSDRFWFALAAYNMGASNVAMIRNTLKATQKNPNSWNDFYDYMRQHKAENSQYTQCMQYVSRIRGFIEAIEAEKQFGKS